jgi:hypothetical protein
MHHVALSLVLSLASTFTCAQVTSSPVLNLTRETNASSPPLSQPHPHFSQRAMIWGAQDPDSIVKKLHISWPPLKIYQGGDAPRSVFKAKLSDRPLVLKLRPLTPRNERHQFACENEAHVHARVTTTTFCKNGTRCECSPNFLPLLYAWKGKPLPRSFFGTSASPATYHNMGLDAAKGEVVYMLIAPISHVSVKAAHLLPGFRSLSQEQQHDFVRYTMFQLSFAIYVLRQLGCMHRDLANPWMDNAKFALVRGQGSDPCSRSGSCPWGYCWRIEGKLWCFDKKKTPLAKYFIRLYDYSSSHCDFSAHKWYEGTGVTEKTVLRHKRGYTPFPDDPAPALVCKHYRLRDCPQSFPPATRGVFAPYYDRFLVDSAPPGACVFGPNLPLEPLGPPLLAGSSSAIAT